MNDNAECGADSVTDSEPMTLHDVVLCSQATRGNFTSKTYSFAAVFNLSSKPILSTVVSVVVVDRLRMVPPPPPPPPKQNVFRINAYVRTCEVTPPPPPPPAHVQQSEPGLNQEKPNIFLILVAA